MGNCLKSRDIVTDRPEAIEMSHNTTQMSRNELKEQISLAAISGNKDMLNDLLGNCNNRTRTEILRDDEYVQSLLFQTLKRGDVESIHLLEKKYKVDIRKFINTDSNACTILCEALLSGHVASVDYVLEKGADVDRHCENHETPLVLACDLGNKDFVDRLVEQGACLEGRVGSAMTPLTAAIRASSLDVVQYLLENGSDPNEWTPEKRKALREAVTCPEGMDVELVKLLLQYKVVPPQDNQEFRPITFRHPAEQDIEEI